MELFMSYQPNFVDSTIANKDQHLVLAERLNAEARTVQYCAPTAERQIFDCLEETIQTLKQLSAQVG